MAIANRPDAFWPGAVRFSLLRIVPLPHHGQLESLEGGLHRVLREGDSTLVPGAITASSATVGKLLELTVDARPPTGSAEGDACARLQLPQPGRKSFEPLPIRCIGGLGPRPQSASTNITSSLFDPRSALGMDDPLSRPRGFASRVVGEGADGTRPIFESKG